MVFSPVPSSCYISPLRNPAVLVTWLFFMVVAAVAVATGGLVQEFNVGIKCATITPDEQRMEGEHDLYDTAQ